VLYRTLDKSKGTLNGKRPVEPFKFSRECKVLIDVFGKFELFFLLVAIGYIILYFKLNENA